MVWCLQHGLVIMFPFGILFAGIGGEVVLTGEAGVQSNPGGLCRGGFKFQDDGSIDELGPDVSTFTQVDPGEWFSSEPVSVGIGSRYEIRSLSVGKIGTWGASPDDDVWVILSSSPSWRITAQQAQSPSSKSVSSTFEIRVAGYGSAIASATFSASVSN